MSNTIIEMGKLYENQKQTIEEVISYYKETKDDIAYAYVFKKVYNLYRNIADKYFTINLSDSESIATTVLLKAINDFDANKGVKFTTMFSTYLNRAFYGESKAQGYHKNSSNYSASSLSNMMDDGTYNPADDDYNYIDVELKETINAVQLSDIERNVCLLLTQSLTDSEIARTLKTSPSRINYTKKNLKKKLSFMIG